MCRFANTGIYFNIVWHKDFIIKITKTIITHIITESSKFIFHRSAHQEVCYLCATYNQMYTNTSWDIQTQGLPCFPYGNKVTQPITTGSTWNRYCPLYVAVPDDCKGDRLFKTIIIIQNLVRARRARWHSKDDSHVLLSVDSAVRTHTQLLTIVNKLNLYSKFLPTIVM